MNAVVPLRPNQPAVPTMSAALRFATNEPFRYTASDGTPCVLHPDRPTTATIAEAQRVLPGFEAAMAAPPRATILQWLRGIAAACRPAPEAAEVEGTATWMAQFSDLPATAYTRETLAHVGNHLPNGYFPAPAKIRELVWPLISDQVERLAALRRVAATPMPQPTRQEQPAPERPAPTEAEREHVRRAAATIRAELNATTERKGRSGSVKAAPISDGALLAAYEAMGDRGRIRAEALRAKIAKGAQNAA